MMVCGNCGGTWAGSACLDCGATVRMIAEAAEHPDGSASLLLNLLRKSLAERGGRIIHSTQQEPDADNV